MSAVEIVVLFSFVFTDEHHGKDVGLEVETGRVLVYLAKQVVGTRDPVELERLGEFLRLQEIRSISVVILERVVAALDELAQPDKVAEFKIRSGGDERVAQFACAVGAEVGSFWVGEQLS
ncbi:hypothetical protein OGAPHI_003802 [Ogataea philodendri]|uniref:Uncharacterized protein n=1 Tax=Ogataea philodendri TaxID=1378263 RepID=A0A9P8T4U3_9ASCO|nr:uncharacterized protein OGAPHI_003802 [Ogataea philodendri]KAH3665614.1 hypothetical protein OGAPHI_003802 [Ogataea philodendri]